MSLASLVKLALSVTSALLLATVALVRGRRSEPPRSDPHPEDPGPTPGRGEPVGLWAILGSGGIVAIVALVGTLASVTFGHVNLREQLAADQRTRATEQAAVRDQREDEQAEERSRRERERVDELYNHAIDRIASGTPELQVVGVYELGGVIDAAAGSDRYDDAAREILAGNLRVFAPPTSGAATPVVPPTSSRAVIRAIVDVLGQHNSLAACSAGGSGTPVPVAGFGDGSTAASLNLTGVNFREQQLARANLTGADLRAADFTGADLSFATLCGADLADATLANARFAFANFSHADLGAARASGADLTAAILTDANLGSADLTGAGLFAADLVGAFLVGADLARADLTMADLNEAVLVRSDLSGAVLDGADLSRADLGWAHLAGANLTDAALAGADLSCADLSAADLSGTDLTQDQLDTAVVDETTRLPDGLDRSRASDPERRARCESER
jgi:uncharacterized protein YjbI with pentapeptide repeats